MQVINYEKCMKKWSPRGTILLLVVSSICTGLFLSAAVLEAAAGKDVWKWGLALAMAFSSGVEALVAASVALQFTKTPSQ